MAISNPLKHMKSISPGRRAAPASPLSACVRAGVSYFLPVHWKPPLHQSFITGIFCVSDYLQSLNLWLPYTFPGDNTSGVCHSTQVHLQCKTLITKHSTAFLSRGQERPRDVTPIANIPPTHTHPTPASPTLTTKRKWQLTNLTAGLCLYYRDLTSAFEH